jgi:hypothetical protein
VKSEKLGFRLKHSPNFKLSDWKVVCVMNTKKGSVSRIAKCQIAVTSKVLLEFYTCTFQVTAISMFKSEY